MSEEHDQKDTAGAAPSAPAPQVNPVLASLAGMLGGKKPAPAAAAQPAPAAAPVKQPAQPSAKSTGKPAAAKPAADLPPGPLYTVATRNEFYRDGFRHLVIVAVIQAAIVLSLIVAITIQVNATKSIDRYFATTADGRIMQLVPLDQPNLSTAALMSWVAQAASEVMTFGYHDYQRRLQQSSKYFTRTGWDSFTTALQNSRILDGIEAQQQVVTATPAGAPVLLQQGVIGGTYRWAIELPLQITYRSAAATRTDTLKLSLVVDRVPSLENPYGVGIEQWIAVQQ